MRVITCNIRFSSSGSDFGSRLWENRRELCLKTIIEQDPDIICLQECHNDQLADFIVAIGDNYDYFHGNSYPTDYFPENVIFYRKTHFTLKGCGAWHLSEKPHVCGSKSWGSECVRLVNWVLLYGPRGLFRIINTHFDHASQLAREKAAVMVNEDCDVWDKELPQILTGDLNCDPDNLAIKTLEENNWLDTMPEKDRYAVTCHEFKGKEGNFDFGICGKGRMDYIYIRGKLRTRDCRILDNSDNNVYPSDHYFVCSDIDFTF